MSDQEWNENWETIYSEQPFTPAAVPEQHEGRWVGHESYSGQDDTFWIECSCGWVSARIWSRYEEQWIGEAFNRHVDAEASRHAQP